MSRIRGIHDKLASKKRAFLFSILGLILPLDGALLSMGHFNLAAWILLGTLFGVRAVTGDKPAFRVSNVRRNGNSLVLADDKKRGFIAVSSVKVVYDGRGHPVTGNPIQDKTTVFEATNIIARHIGACSIELNGRPPSLRYIVKGEAKTVVEACQTSEASAERLLRILRRLYGEEARSGILEGEQLYDELMGIIGGQFRSLLNAGNVVLRDSKKADEANGFALLTVRDESIGILSLMQLLSLISDLDGNISYVINMKAHSTSSDNALIDGSGHANIWAISSYFMINGKGVKAVTEKAFEVKRIIESLTRADMLKIERGSSALRKVGKIIARSPIDKRLLLSNRQLVSHLYGVSAQS